MRGSSVHFKRITSAIHAVSHASRDVAPEYLLPEGMSLGTHVVIDDAGQVQRLLEHKLSLASRQAKATKDYSPMWEGVINLPDPADATPQQQIEIVKKWCAAYEKMTGHKVIRADVHLDEGFVDEAGKPRFNAHAHVMCDRTDDKGKVKKLTSTVLREVQNMTAEVTTLARGLDARTTGRKHIGHQHFRYDAEKNRLDLEKEKKNFDRFQKLSKGWADEDFEKIKKLQAHIDSEPERLAAALTAQKLQLDEKYKQDRATLKASGEATQRDYQQLKKDHEKALADLVEARQQAATAISEKDTLAQRYKAFKEKAQGVVGEQNQKIAGLIGELEEAKKPVLHQPPPQIPQSNLQATASRPPEASKTAQEPSKQQEAPVTPREAFMALYEGVKAVLVGMIDGMRLDAAEGRLGLFSSHNRTGPRVQVLCDVPENKVMPKIGEVFDSRAIPGRGKGGIGD